MACAWLMKRIVVHVANKISIPVAASPPPVLRQTMSMWSARREGQVAASGAVARGDPPRCSREHLCCSCSKGLLGLWELWQSISPPKDLKVHSEPPVTHMGYTGNTREK